MCFRAFWHERDRLLFYCIHFNHCRLGNLAENPAVKHLVGIAVLRLDPVFACRIRLGNGYGIRRFCLAFGVYFSQDYPIAIDQTLNVIGECCRFTR